MARTTTRKENRNTRRRKPVESKPHALSPQDAELVEILLEMEALRARVLPFTEKAFYPNWHICDDLHALVWMLESVRSLVETATGFAGAVELQRRRGGKLFEVVLRKARGEEIPDDLQAAAQEELEGRAGRKATA